MKDEEKSKKNHIGENIFGNINYYWNNIYFQDVFNQEIEHFESKLLLLLQICKIQQ